MIDLGAVTHQKYPTHVINAATYNVWFSTRFPGETYENFLHNISLTDPLIVNECERLMDNQES